MISTALGALLVFVGPADRGPFEAAGLYLVRVTAVEVPDHQRLFGRTRMRVDEVLTGPRKIKNNDFWYEFFAPRYERGAKNGFQYSGYYPDFAYPAPKGQSRIWIVTDDVRGAGSVTTADFRKVAKYLPTRVAETLLKAELKPDTPEAQDRAELAAVLVNLESKKSRLDQFTLLRQLQDSKTNVVQATASRMINTLTTSPKDKK